MTATDGISGDGTPDVPELISVHDSSAFEGNDVRMEVHTKAGGMGTGRVMRLEGGSSITGSFIDFQLSYGVPLSPERGPVRPCQISATKFERDEIRRELAGLAEKVDCLIGKFPLSRREASERSGLGEDWPAVLEWRRSYDQALEARYRVELHPHVTGTYRRARVRGFFHADFERSYDATVLIRVRDFPEILREIAEMP